MLPPFIIEQIRQREEKERSQQEENRPRLELPILDRYPSAPRKPDADEEEVERGVIILDLM